MEFEGYRSSIIIKLARRSNRSAVAYMLGHYSICNSSGSGHADSSWASAGVLGAHEVCALLDVCADVAEHNATTGIAAHAGGSTVHGAAKGCWVYHSVHAGNSAKTGGASSDGRTTVPRICVPRVGSPRVDSAATQVIGSDPAAAHVWSREVDATGSAPSASVGAPVATGVAPRRRSNTADGASHNGFVKVAAANKREKSCNENCCSHLNLDIKISLMGT